MTPSRAVSSCLIHVPFGNIVLPSRPAALAGRATSGRRLRGDNQDSLISSKFVAVHADGQNCRHPAGGAAVSSATMQPSGIVGLMRSRGL